MTTSAEGDSLHEIAPGIRRLRAPNPSPMTATGTNTYILGTSTCAIIDPGPGLAAHLDRLLEEIAGATVSAILVTHSHRDHSALAGPLAQRTGAPVLAFGASAAGRNATVERLAGALGGGEGVDVDFEPDVLLADGETLSGPDWEITALWTPGHMGNHLCFALGDVLFTGDLVMGWSTSLISPPDGDLDSFVASCLRLATRNDRILLPGHGAPVTDPSARLETLLAHRAARSAALREALADGPATAATLTRRVYHDLDPKLLPAAERNLLAHLISQIIAGEVTAETPLRPETVYAATPDAPRTSTP